MSTPERFLDRRYAGRQLAVAVKALGLENPVVLALPRGGVPVAYEVAQALAAHSTSSSCAKSALRITRSSASAR
jgi:predicted phosphoribosyltransferase